MFVLKSFVREGDAQLTVLTQTHFRLISHLPSISSTFYVQIFRTNVVLAAFSTYM